MRRAALASLMAFALFMAAPAPAQSQLAVGVQAGTIGMGGTVAYGLNPSLVVRGSVNITPYKPKIDLDQINYKAEFPTPQFLFTADFHPGGSAFYLSGGLHISSNDLKVTATLAEAQEIGDQTYQPSQVGKLIGTASTRSAAPYVGIGFGNPVGEGRQIGLILDLGVSFVGKPDIGLRHEGGTLSVDDAALQANLDLEAQKAENDIPSWVKAYPILSLGLTFRVGGR